MRRLHIHPSSPLSLHMYASEKVEGFDVAIVETTPHTQGWAGVVLDFNVEAHPWDTGASVEGDQFKLHTKLGDYYMAAMADGVRRESFAETVGSTVLQALKYAQDKTVAGGMWIKLDKTVEECFGLDTDELASAAFVGVLTGIKQFFIAMHEEDPEDCLSAIAIEVSPRTFKMLNTPTPAHSLMNSLMTSGGIFRVLR